jgi:hypothetical protein
VTLRVSGTDIKLRAEPVVFHLLTDSPPAVGTAIEVTSGPLGLLMGLRW